MIATGSRRNSCAECNSSTNVSPMEYSRSALSPRSTSLKFVNWTRYSSPPARIGKSLLKHSEPLPQFIRPSERSDCPRPDDGGESSVISPRALLLFSLEVSSGRDAFRTAGGNYRVQFKEEPCRPNHPRPPVRLSADRNSPL